MKNIFINRKDLEILDKYIQFMLQQSDNKGFTFKGDLKPDFIEVIKKIYNEINKDK